MDEINRNLDKVATAMIKGATKGTRLAGKHLQGEAKKLAPVAKDFGGALRESIQEKAVIEEGTIESIIYSNLDYAPYVEFGTGQRGEASPSLLKSPQDISYKYDWAGMEAQPFLYPAMLSSKETVRNTIKESIQEALGDLS